MESTDIGITDPTRYSITLGMMALPSSVVTSVAATDATGKQVIMSPSFNKTSSDLPNSKLRSLLPKSLLNQSSKSQVQVETLQLLNNPEARTSPFTNSNTFQVGEIIMTQPGDEVRPLQDGTVASSPETMDTILKHLNGSSASHVVALTEAQVQKLLAVSPSGGVSGKPQVLHMVTVEDSAEPQPLSMALDDQPLSVTLEGHPVSLEEEPAGLEANPLSMMPSTSQLSATMAPPATIASQHLPVNSVQAAPEIYTVPESKDLPSSEPQVLHVSASDRTPDVDAPTQDKDKEEVVKKTMVEAFVKMVVCRKVTVQTVNQSTGQILDTNVKLVCIFFFSLVSFLMY